MRNGAAGLRRYGRSSTERTENDEPVEALGESARAHLVELDDSALAKLARRRLEVLSLGDSGAVERDQPRLERAGIEGGEKIPVLGRPERHPLALALHHETRRHRLHAAGREAAGHLLPEHGGHLVAVETIEDPACLLRIDQAIVDVPRLVQGPRDRVLRDLVEDHAPHGDLRLQHLDEMPGDRLALAILVRREEELVRAGEVLLELADRLLLLGLDDVVRLESLVDVDTERTEALPQGSRHVRRTARKVADVPHARPEHVAVSEVARDRARFRGALDDDEALAHRRDTLALCFSRPPKSAPQISAAKVKGARGLGSAAGGRWPGFRGAILPPVASTPRPSWLYLLVGAVSWPVVKLVFRHRATGSENVPSSGGFVLAANHWSNFDPWPLAVPFFPRRFFRFMAKAELFWFPLGSIIAAAGAFKVRRGEQDEEAIATAIRARARGKRGRDVSGGNPATEGPAQAPRGALADRCRADRSHRRRPARAGRDLGHGPSGAARAAASRVRTSRSRPNDLGALPMGEAARVGDGSAPRCDRRARAEPRVRPLLVDRRRLVHAPRVSRAARSRCAARTAGRRTRSAASPTCSCASGVTSGRGPCSSRGTRSTSRRIGTRRSRRIRAGGCSRPSCSSSSICFPTSSASIGFACAKARWVRGGRLPRGCCDAGGSGRRDGARRDVRPGRIPARDRARDRPAAGARAVRHGSARPRFASATASILPRFRTSSRSGVIRRTGFPAREGSARSVEPTCSRSTARSTRCSRRVASRPRRMRFVSIAASRPWIATAPLPPLPDVAPGLGRRRRSRDGSSARPGVARRFEEALDVDADQPSAVRHAARARVAAATPRSRTSPVVSTTAFPTTWSAEPAIAEPDRARPRAALRRLHRGDRRARSGSIPTRTPRATTWEAACLAAGCAIDAVERGGVRAGSSAGPPRARRRRRWASASSANVAIAARYAQLELGRRARRRRRLRRPPRKRHGGAVSRRPVGADGLAPSVAVLARDGRAGSRARTGSSTSRSRPARATTSTAAAFDEVVEPAVRAFEPELVIVAAGFDAHRDDPLAEMADER